MVGDDFAFVNVDVDDDESCRRCNKFRVDKVKPDKRAKTMACGCTTAEDSTMRVRKSRPPRLLSC